FRPATFGNVLAGKINERIKAFQFGGIDCVLVGMPLQLTRPWRTAHETNHVVALGFKLWTDRGAHQAARAGDCDSHSGSSRVLRWERRRHRNSAPASLATRPFTFSPATRHIFSLCFRGKCIECLGSTFKSPMLRHRTLPVVVSCFAFVWLAS